MENLYSFIMMPIAIILLIIPIKYGIKLFKLVVKALEKYIDSH